MTSNGKHVCEVFYELKASLDVSFIGMPGRIIENTSRQI